VAVGLGSEQWSERSPNIGAGPLHLPEAVPGIQFLDVLLRGMVAAGQGIQAICLYLGLTRIALDGHLVRLALKTPHDRPPRSGGRRPWSLLDTVRLIAYRMLCVHPRTIALRLDRSVGSIYSKLRRLGVPAPPRSSLVELDPAALPNLTIDWWRKGLSIQGLKPGDRCGTIAGPISIRGGSATGASATVVGEPSPAPTRRAERPVEQARRKASPAVERRPTKPADRCGTAAGPASVAGTSRGESERVGSALAAASAMRAEPQHAAQTQPARSTPLFGELAPAGAEPPSGKRATLRHAKAESTAGQREMPFYAVVASGEAARETAANLVENPPCQDIPSRESDVDFSGDLTWIGNVRPVQKHRLAVWVIGMLFLGGLNWREVARRVGIKATSLKDSRRRMGIPRAEDKSKLVWEFDEYLARATADDWGYKVKQCTTSGRFFWENKSGCTMCPEVRRKLGLYDAQIEGRGPSVNHLTYADLEAMRPRMRPPFAQGQAIMAAG
jgi:hypothetical protein